MTSYRGVEATDCVGMQPFVEPAMGYAVTTNRLGFRTERKRVLKSLA